MRKKNEKNGLSGVKGRKENVKQKMGWGERRWEKR